MASKHRVTEKHRRQDPRPTKNSRRRSVRSVANSTLLTRRAAFSEARKSIRGVLTARKPSLI